MNNVGLGFRELLTGGLQVVQDQLDQIIASMQGTWNEEHKASGGGHGDITADSLTLNTDPTFTGTLLGDLQVNGQQRFLRGPWFLDPPGNNIHIAGLRPPQITANQNNYNPSGLDRALMVEVDTDADRTITGLSAPRRQKRLLMFGNRGNFIVTLSHNDAGSSGVNRFGMPNGVSLVLGANEYVWLYYDVGSEIWRAVSVL